MQHLESSKFNLQGSEGFAAIHEIPISHLQPTKFSWRLASLPIRHGGLGIVPAAAVADAAYVGSVTDTSNLANILTISIRERHPYLPEELTRSALQRIY